MGLMDDDRRHEAKPSVGVLLTKEPSLIRRMFSSIAPRYDLLNRLLSLFLDPIWRRAAVCAVKAAPGDRILDLCCGTGDLALAFAQAGHQGSVTGIDFARPMLAIARRKLDLMRLHVGLVEGDALLLPFSDGGFDVGAVAFGLRNLKDLHRGIQEIARVLKPGGRIVVLEFSRPTGPFLRVLHGLYLRAILPSIARVFSPACGNAYRYLPLSIIGFSHGADIVAEMDRCGLRQTATRRITFGAVHLHTARKEAESS